MEAFITIKLNSMDKETVQKGKTGAIIAYFTFVGLLIALTMNADNRNEFTAFHIRQSLGLNILFILLGSLVTGFDTWLISAPFYVIFSILWFFAFINMLQNRRQLIPFIGTYCQKWFKKI